MSYADFAPIYTERDKRIWHEAFGSGFAVAKALLGEPNTEVTDIKNVIYNPPATIVMWADGSKTVVKCSERDTYDAEKGLAMCFAKRLFGDKGNYNEVFKKWERKKDRSKCLRCVYNNCNDYSVPCGSCELFVRKTSGCRCDSIADSTKCPYFDERKSIK